MMSWPGGTLYSPMQGYKEWCNIRERKTWEQKHFSVPLLVDTTQAAAQQAADQTFWPQETVVIVHLLSLGAKSLNSQSFSKIEGSGKCLWKIHFSKVANAKYFDILKRKGCVWLCPLELLLLLLGPVIQVLHLPQISPEGQASHQGTCYHVSCDQTVPRKLPTLEGVRDHWKRSSRKGPGSTSWKALFWSRLKWNVSFYFPSKLNRKVLTRMTFLVLGSRLL